MICPKERLQRSQKHVYTNPQGLCRALRGSRKIRLTAEKRERPMATAFIDRQPISRSRGHNLIQKAAYNACTRLSEQADFRRKKGLAYEEMITDTETDRAAFWAAAEAQEKRNNAQLGYSYTAALPLELDTKQQIALAQEYAKRIKDRYSFEAVDLAIHHPQPDYRKAHAKKEKENPHVHLLTPSRTREGKKLRLYGDTADLLAIRQLWQNCVNAALARAGLEIKINVRKTEDQIASITQEITDLEAQEKNIEHNLILVTLEEADLEQKTRIATAAAHPEPERLPQARVSNLEQRIPARRVFRRPNQLGKREEGEKPRQTLGQHQRNGGEPKQRVRRNLYNSGQIKCAAELGREPDPRKNPSATGAAGGSRSGSLLWQWREWRAKATAIADRLGALRWMREETFLQNQNKYFLAASLIAARLNTLAKHGYSSRNKVDAGSQNTPRPQL